MLKKAPRAEVACCDLGNEKRALVAIKLLLREATHCKAF